MQTKPTKPTAPPLAAVDDDGLDNVLPPERAAPVTNNVTGRVKFDDRGNAIWEWAVSTGKFGIEVTSTRLKKLANHSLTIHEDGDSPSRAAAAAMPSAAAEPVKENRKGVTQGYSPYDSGLLVKAQDDAKKTKKKDLRRLSEWLKLREQVTRNKQSDD